MSGKPRFHKMPEVAAVQLNAHVTPEIGKIVDDYRKKFDPVPSRSSVLRYIVEKFFEELKE